MMDTAAPSIACAVIRPLSAALDYTAERPLCSACGVFAVLMVAIWLPGGSPIYAPTSLCGVCRDNYLYVRRP